MLEIPFLSGVVILDKNRKYLQVSEDERYIIQSFDYDKVEVGEYISGLVFQYRNKMQDYVYPGTIKKEQKK